jgi:hypothetical protein
MGTAFRLDGFESPAGAFTNGATEILVQGIERVGSEFGEDSTECPFNAVDCVEEVSAVDFELAGAELPVCAEQEIVAEQAMIFLIEHAPAYETEVGHEFFLLTGVDAAPARAGAELPGNGPEWRPVGGAIAEAL